MPHSTPDSTQTSLATSALRRKLSFPAPKVTSELGTRSPCLTSQDPGVSSRGSQVGPQDTAMGNVWKSTCLAFSSAVPNQRPRGTKGKRSSSSRRITQEGTGQPHSPNVRQDPGSCLIHLRGQEGPCAHAQPPGPGSPLCMPRPSAPWGKCHRIPI